MRNIGCFIICLLLTSITHASQNSLTDIALNAYVEASSEERPAIAAVDGDDSSYWQSGSTVGNHWLIIDFEKYHQIDRVVIPHVIGVDSLVVKVETADSQWERVYAGGIDNPLIGFEPQRTRRIKLESINGGQMRVYEVKVYEYDSQPVFVNQSGYEIEGSKRFTAPLASEGAIFTITRNIGSDVLYKGEISGKIGDFTDFRPKGDPGPYVIHASGKNGEGKSVPFKIGPNWIERVTYQPAIDFMVDTRCWFGNSTLFEPSDDSPGCPNFGVAWRDSHQFSFEIQSLLHLYFSNPSAFNINRMQVQGAYLGLREELPVQTPEIVRLIYWAVDIYLRGEVNHTLLKQQIAYFVYAWPWLSEYIPEKVYDEAMEYVFSTWGEEQINRWQWYDLEHTGDLFQTFTILGTGKGELPIGHSIVPNLLMYEVAKREDRDDSDKYFQAAYNQTEWLIENIDWQDPLITKGQRQGEWVFITSLVYFLEHYPKRAPKALEQNIEQWADVVIQRSDNMWDFRRYSEDRWIIPSIPGHTSETGFNEVGNNTGFPAALKAAAGILNDQHMIHRLNEIAVSHIDHVFGRNPAGRHLSYDGTVDFEGVEKGWFQEYQGGAGNLQVSRGVLDGSPKEPLFPYNPYAGDPGHTEGWVAFNTPWNISLAYNSAQKISISVHNLSFTEEITVIKPGDEIGIELMAPLNFDYTKKEKAEAIINLDNRKVKVALQETETSSNEFRGTYTLPNTIRSNKMEVSYGYGWFEESNILKIES
jgi:hypothetical protein